MEVPVSIAWMLFVLLFTYFGAYLMDSNKKNKDQVFSFFVFFVILGAPVVSTYLIVPMLDMLVFNKENPSIEEAHIMNPFLYMTIFAIAHALAFLVGFRSNQMKTNETNSDGVFGPITPFGIWKKYTERKLREKELEVEKIRQKAKLQESLNEGVKLKNDLLGKEHFEMNNLTKRKLFNEKIRQQEKHVEALEATGKNLEAAKLKAKIEELKRKAAEAGYDPNP